LIAAGAGAEDVAARTTSGIRVGIGTIDLPGFHSGPPIGHFAAHVERMFSAKDSVIAGIGYQRLPSVQYRDDPTGTDYSVGLASTFVGVKSRPAAQRSGPYVAATVGLSQWSGRAGDIQFSPTVDGIVGADLAVHSRSKVFAEVGVRAGKLAFPRWIFGVGYATGL
jgi:hypothetical protein